MRQRPIPWAYRVFFRQIGLDPDQTRTPIEELALERMKKGAFVSRSQLDDALTIAIVETGVALRAFDADRTEGRGVHPKTARITLAALAVKGVPDIAVEEALWLATAALTI
ncbi:MAG TPA: hypothetical protein VIL53_01820 [Solirubrobacterales bacterium]